MVFRFNTSVFDAKRMALKKIGWEFSTDQNWKLFYPLALMNRRFVGKREFNRLT